MNISIKKPDNLGIMASVLCLLHCLVTPLLFVAQASATNHLQKVPFWWGNIDYVFLLISFFAIYKTTKTTSKNRIKLLLWCNWVFLVFLIINEKINIFHIPELIMYATSLSLASIHIYNLKYCKCKEDTCCASNHL